MFNKKLFEFQSLHEENLLKKCIDNYQMILSAPTGSGKTILVSKFIVDYLDENPSTVFLWLSPGAGGLHKQSQESFEDSTSGIFVGDIYDFITETSPEGKVYFVNWDKIIKSSNTVLKEGEFKNLMERISDCHRNKIPIFLLIDEEQRFQSAAENFAAIVTPDKILRISATPLTKNTYTETITDEEVISEGLIASSISINEGLSKTLEDNNNFDDDILLIKLADEKRIQIQNEYQRIGLKIRPLVIIQFPNGNPEWIERVKNALDKMGYGSGSGLVTSWFSGDHPENPEEIIKLDGKYSFLLFKQAISAGWDCPRAKILVKLREGGSETFNIQTIGRVRRMPERKHYNNEILDRCYVYTLDNEFKTGLTDSISESFYSYMYKLKNINHNFDLTKEYLDGNDKYSINPESVIKVIHDAFLKKYDINKNGKIDLDDLKTKFGFIISYKLKTSAFEGVARTTNDIKNLKQIFGGEHEINNHEDGFIIRDAKRRIAASLKLEENISNNALRIIFGPCDNDLNIFSQEDLEFEKKYKLIEDFDLRLYNAFLINNKNILIELFSEVNANEIADIEESKVINKNWTLPKTQYYKIHKRITGNKVMTKNVFENYMDNILVDPNRSTTERLFESWCENYNKVKFVYKNGDKGSEYFSLVYRIAFKRANFYPDYLVQMDDGTVWIIEAKGGSTTKGESLNIDLLSKNKLEGLKNYSKKYRNIRWGFVRSLGNNLKISVSEWTEDTYDERHWRPIEEII